MNSNGDTNGTVVDGCKSAATTDETKKKGWALLLYDLKQKELILIKFLTLMFQGCLGVLIPFMTVHMKSLGITVDETAIIYGVIPLFAILAPSTLGIIADKLGNFKVLLSAAFVVKCAIALSFLAIPTGRFIDTYPKNMSLAVGCSSGHPGLLTLSDLDSVHCDFKPSSNLSLTVEECGYLCFDSQSEMEQENNASLPADWPAADQPHHKFRNGLFFQEDWNIQFDCPNRQNNCTLSRQMKNSAMKQMLFHQIIIKNETNNIFTFERMTKETIQCDADYDRPIRLADPLYFQLTNPLKSDQGILSKTLINDNETNQIIYKICKPQCISQVLRSDICANKDHVIVFNPLLTFWIYLVLRLVYQIFLNGSGNLFEGACLAIVTQVKGDLGLQRIFGLVGLMIFSPISGVLMDHFSIGKSIPDYRPAFYLYAGLVAILAVGILGIDLNFKAPNSNLLRDVKILLKNAELVAFILVVFMSGLFMGYIESYLFWFLEEIGGTKSLMGLTVTVACLAGVPILLLSDKIFRKIGQPNVQVIGFIVYTIRLLGYSYIQEPYMCLIYEVLESITTALMLTSMLAYAAQLSTTTTLATVQGLLGATYWGMGRGAGTFIGGFLMKYLANTEDKTYGMRATFRVLGVVSAVTAILYFLFNIFYIRRRNIKLQSLPSNNEIGINNPVFINDLYHIKQSDAVRQVDDS